MVVVRHISIFMLPLYESVEYRPLCTRKMSNSFHLVCVLARADAAASARLRTSNECNELIACAGVQYLMLHFLIFDVFSE